jgi:hypothetical protein
MSNVDRSPRRAILLGMMLSLGFAAFSLTRPVSMAQEPARPIDRKALREQIMALHAEIELLAIDHEIDRAAFSDSVREERAILAKIKPPPNLDVDGELFDKCGIWIGAWLDFAVEEKVSEEELRKGLSENSTKERRDETAKVFGTELAEKIDSLAKKTNKDEFSLARRHLADRFLEEIYKRATVGVRAKNAIQRKEFTRQAAELAGKRLDLETFERQYREAR